MTIVCYTSIYGTKVWLLDDDGYSIKFQFSYRNNYYISHDPFDFIIFNFGEE